MGCVNKQPVNYESARKTQQEGGLKSYSSSAMAIQQTEKSKTVKFNHAPLKDCNFLFDKFKKSDGSPQQLTLGFMILNTQVNQSQRQITVNYINGNPANIWVLVAGVQRISQTGLSVDIHSCASIQMVKIQSASKKQGESKTFQIDSKISGSVIIILQPLNIPGQTIFLINRYQIQPNEKYYSLISQSLQWNSLAFQLMDIYGAQNIFKVDQQEPCSICLTNQCNSILMPCRHMCLCSQCSVKYEKNMTKCPLCRKQYYSVIKYK